MTKSTTGYDDPDGTYRESNQHWFVETIEHWINPADIVGRLLVNGEPRGLIRFKSEEELTWLNERLQSPRIVSTPSE